MHRSSETQSPVGEAFLAAVHDVEMLEASPVAVTHWSPAIIVPDSVSQPSTERPASVPTRSSSRVLEHRATIASVVTASDVALLSSLQEINRVLVTPVLAAPAAVRQRLNVREKLYSDLTVPPLPEVRDRSPVRQLSKMTPPSSGVLVSSQAAGPDCGLKQSPSGPSIMVEVPNGVHAVTVMPTAVARVGVQVHWGGDVCEGSSPPPKRLSGSFREGGAVDVEPQSSEDDYGEISFRASLFGSET